MADPYQVNQGYTNTGAFIPGYVQPQPLQQTMYGQEVPNGALNTNGFVNTLPQQQQQAAKEAQAAEAAIVGETLKQAGFSQTQIQGFLQQYTASKYSGPQGQVNLASLFATNAQGGSGYGYFPDMNLLNQITGDARLSQLADANMRAQNLASAIAIAKSNNSWGGSGSQNLTAKAIELQKELDALNKQIGTLQNGFTPEVEYRAITNKDGSQTVTGYIGGQRVSGSTFIVPQGDPRNTSNPTRGPNSAAAQAAQQQPQGPQFTPAPTYGQPQTGYQQPQGPQYYGQQGQPPQQGYAQPAGQQAPAANSGGGQPQSELAQQLAQQYQAQIDAANAANQARYEQSLGELTSLRDRTMGNINQLGVNARLDIADQLAQSQGATTQSAINRGLYNTTILDSLQSGNQRTADRANIALEESLARQRADADLQTTGAITNLIGQKVDQGPDQSQLIALSQNLGQYGNTPVEGQQQTPAATPAPTPAPAAQQQYPINYMGQQQGGQIPQYSPQPQMQPYSTPPMSAGGVNGYPNSSAQQYASPAYPSIPGAPTPGNTFMPYPGQQQQPNYSQGYGVQTNRGYLSNDLATFTGSPQQIKQGQQNMALFQQQQNNQGYQAPAPMTYKAPTNPVSQYNPTAGGTSGGFSTTANKTPMSTAPTSAGAMLPPEGGYQEPDYSTMPQYQNQQATVIPTWKKTQSLYPSA